MDYQTVINALRDRARKFASLDNQPDADLGDMAIDIGAGFVPGLGTAQAGRDFERARREGDKLGMGLAGIGMVPVVGGVTKGISALRKAKQGTEAATDAAPSLRQVLEQVASTQAANADNVMSPQARVAAEKRMMKEAIPAKADASIYATRPTVDMPDRVAFPGIYKRPDALVAGARVAPEDPLLKQLFNVSRDDLYEISQQGKRQGNIKDRPFVAPPGAKGARHAERVMTPKNEQRILDIISEAEKRPDLYKGMSSWYTMDPAYEQFVRLYGKERAPMEYDRFNTLTGMASPGSEVMVELNRGSAANWLDKQGRFADFLRHGGGMTKDSPADMAAIMGHPYHKTAQGIPMQKYLNAGEVDMASAKVPSYITASGVPETGFQTAWPVGDAHWSRLLGLPDVRGARTSKGKDVVPGASASVPEMVSLGPWWQKNIASQAGIESVPAQAVVWGAGSNATGVTSPIGAPKLELLASQIGKTAKRLGVTPEQARDMVLTGKAHAGFVTPEMAALLGTGAVGAATVSALRERKKKEEEVTE